jgi:hypothetical protein
MRYCVFALTQVVGFMAGFFIPVVADLFVNGTGNDGVTNSPLFTARGTPAILNEARPTASNRPHPLRFARRPPLVAPPAHPIGCC